MEQNILDTIKILLGIQIDYDAFDDEIIYNINSAFMDLFQIGFGDKPFSINTKHEIWANAVPNEKFFESIKLYIFKKVKISFDPPSSSFVLDAMKNQLQEIEWRLNMQKEEFEKEEENESNS